MGQCISYLLTSRKPVYDSFKREVLYNILLEFGIPKKLVGIIEMCLNETYSKICLDKHLFDTFPIQNGVKQGDALSPFPLEQECLFALFYSVLRPV
jgi:hypothetical protein